MKRPINHNIERQRHGPNDPAISGFSACDCATKRKGVRKARGYAPGKQTHRPWSRLRSHRVCRLERELFGPCRCLSMLWFMGRFIYSTVCQTSSCEISRRCEMRPYGCQPVLSAFSTPSRQASWVFFAVVCFASLVSISLIVDVH